MNSYCLTIINLAKNLQKKKIIIDIQTSKNEVKF